MQKLNRHVLAHFNEKLLKPFLINETSTEIIRNAFIIHLSNVKSKDVKMISNDFKSKII